MSALVRTGLRIGAVELLKADPAIAHLLGTRIYDSLIGEIEVTDPVPAMIVTTENADGDSDDPSGGGPNFSKETCDLVCEFFIMARHQVNEQEWSIGRPVTSPEMEASLDLIESRIAAALILPDTPLAMSFNRYILKRILSYSCERLVSEEPGVYFASRVFKLRCEIKPQIHEVFYGTIGGNAVAPPDILPTGDFARLPRPLRDFAPALPQDSYGNDILKQIAAAFPAPDYDPAFTGADQTIILTV